MCCVGRAAAGRDKGGAVRLANQPAARASASSASPRTCENAGENASFETEAGLFREARLGVLRFLLCASRTTVSFVSDFSRGARLATRRIFLRFQKSARARLLSKKRGKERKVRGLRVRCGRRQAARGCWLRRRPVRKRQSRALWPRSRTDPCL